MRASVKGLDVLVLGSAPKPLPEENIFKVCSLFTVNAAQTIFSDKSNTKIPNLTLFNPMLVTKKRKSSRLARHVLSGFRTNNLLVLNDKNNLFWIKFRLFFMRYRYQTITMLSDIERKMILDSILSRKKSDFVKPSNGVFMALLALRLGASKVVMAGFSLSKTGHSYNNLNLKRSHVHEDIFILNLARQLNLPIFAADREFSLESGLPLFKV